MPVSDPQNTPASMFAFVLALLPSTLAASPHLNVELIGSWNPNPPPRVPATDLTAPLAGLGDDNAYPLRFGVGYAQGDLLVQVRRETMLGAWDAFEPRTYDVRVGRIRNAKGGTWGAREPFHSYAEVVAPFVGYRAVTDMYTDNDSFSLLNGRGPVASDGHGVEVGLYFGQPDQDMWAEFTGVYYAVGWPSEDRPRYGLLARGGLAMGPLLGGVRLDLDPGTGGYAAIELGMGGFVNVSPADWKRP